MDEYAGRVLADRYRLPLPPAGSFELSETPAFDSYSGQEVLVRQVLLPEVVDAEVLDGQGGTHDYAEAAPPGARATHPPAGRPRGAPRHGGRPGRRTHPRPPPARPGLRRLRRGRFAVDRQ
ncbi:hypothetical protein Sdia_17480 [Streptomyces diastaticus subsp. diastaticus]|uniref:Serine/threonine protein kinase n=1 Tax=Streptomyces diastaticus subsp. diastaticus TaxID=68040 RepID=A0ABQ1CL29_STRDI|nr:hypothetical protein Sdia_03700 [Streptomyces diastaticus subsp. diastaticus]GFH70980.1 hypothetical protein Sdia_17480 [Streptomyces diastaticus subsp. diastaticus]